MKRKSIRFPCSQRVGGLVRADVQTAKKITSEMEPELRVGNTDFLRYRERHMMVCRSEAPKLRFRLYAAANSELGWYRENALVP